MTEATEDTELEGIEVELPVEEAEADAPIIETPAEPVVPTVDEGIEELRQRLAAEEAARRDAEDRARHANAQAAEANSRVHKAQTEVQDTNLALLKNAIDQRKQAAEHLENQYEIALQNGDHRAAVQVQRQLARNEAELLQLEQGEASLRNAPKPAPVAAAPVGDPVDVLAAQMVQSGSPRSASWIKSHPEYVREPKLYQKMLAAHNIAMADGLQPDTDEYFNSIEGILRIKPATEAAPAPIVPRQAAPAAAPASRQSGSVGASAPNRVTLSREEVEIAEMMGMDPKEYARNKMALKKAGKIG